MPSSTDCRPVRVGREMDREERGKKGSGLSQSHGDRDTEMEKETRKRDTERERTGKREREQGQGSKSECGGGTEQQKKKTTGRNFGLAKKSHLRFSITNFLHQPNTSSHNRCNSYCGVILNLFLELIHFTFITALREREGCQLCPFANEETEAWEGM